MRPCLRRLRPRLRLPGPRATLGAPWSWLWALWLAPTNLLGWAAAAVIGRGQVVRHRGRVASAWLREIRPGVGFDWVGAVTLGHVVLHRPGFFAGARGRLILAHELAHTRQHDVLGPAYLPLHILAQTVSAILSLGRTVKHSRVHDFNPLEQTFICLGASAYDELARGAPAHHRAHSAAEVLNAFGLDPDLPLGRPPQAGAR